VKPKDFLGLAQELAGGGNPAKNRTAINRAYYSAYHTGKAILAQMKCPTSRHGDVWDLLRHSGSEQVEDAGDSLSDLYSQRHKADYELLKPGPEDDKTAKAVIEQAEKVIRCLDECFSGAQGPAITQTIQVYYSSTP